MCVCPSVENALCVLGVLVVCVCVLGAWVSFVLLCARVTCELSVRIECAVCAVCALYVGDALLCHVAQHIHTHTHTQALTACRTYKLRDFLCLRVIDGVARAEEEEDDKDPVESRLPVRR